MYIGTMMEGLLVSLAIGCKGKERGTIAQHPNPTGVKESVSLNASGAKVRFHKGVFGCVHRGQTGASGRPFSV